MSVTRPSPLLSEIRREALMGPDSGSKIARDALRLCDEYEAMRRVAMKAKELPL